MRDTSPRRWRWRRVPLAEPAPGANRLTGILFPASPSSTTEQPGPDGIRHGLVARIQAEIAAGTYDSEEKWLAAEDALLRRIEQRI